ncbi:cation diffusion facilitator family transporter [Caloranaerobacter ferrireducens]|uniref:cation diffusion facilitator family transporter n=1 Tax=Caloranaerobacter ferrireducens TaxID=1323370 RepID=UPI00084D28B2|nr:cation diffusion facilitator family transporter [Caloranaerobacter ferrireducens]
MKNNAIDENKRYKIASRVTWLTIILNVILAVGKIIIGLISNSNAILADGIHTISDIGSSIGIVIGFFIAKKPEDEEHQYGHEKAETIAAFLLSLMLIAVGVKIGISSLKLMLYQTTRIPAIEAIWAAGISIIVKELQFRMAMNVGKKINSKALIADAWHHRSDALSSIAALFGVIGARMGYPLLDPLAGLIVSIIVVKVGVEFFIHGYNELMDISIEESKLYEIAERLMKNTNIKNINDIKARKHGSKVYVDIKICVDPNITVYMGHSIAEEVEEEVKKSLDNVKDVMVHVNPCSNYEEMNCLACKNKTSKYVKKEDTKNGK